MEDRAKHRVRLMLRSERAMGVSIIPAVVDISPVQQTVGAAPATVPTRIASTNSPAAMPMPSRSPAMPPQSSAAAQAASRTTPAVPNVAPRAKPAASIGLFGVDVSASSGGSSLLPVFTTPPLPSDEKLSRLTAMNDKEVRGCKKCRLCETRTNTVFGEGDHDARLMFIGEGPGENEDLQGRPFVGRAGQLLDKMIVAMGLRREQVFIANIVKCRPPQNREPAPDETATCTPYLTRQIEIIRPQVIVTLGRPSTQHMLQSKESMSRLRGHWHDYRGIKVMPTYHPAYILRSYTEQVRAAVWSDLKQVMEELGLKVPAKKGGM